MPLYAYGTHEDDMVHTMESTTSLPVVEAARREFPDERVCIGIVQHIDPAMYIRADDVIDRMRDGLFEEHEELTDRWLENVSPSDHEILTTKLRFVVRDWLKQTGNRLNAYFVRDIEWYEP